MPDILTYLQAKECLFTIQANTLEDIYIKMEGGGNLIDPEIHEKKEEQLKDIEELFMQTYHASYFKVLWGLLYRKILFNFSSALQIMMAFFFSFFPGSVSVFVGKNIIDLMDVETQEAFNPLYLCGIITIYQLGIYYTGFAH